MTLVQTSPASNPYGVAGATPGSRLSALARETAAPSLSLIGLMGLDALAASGFAVALAGLLIDHAWRGESRRIGLVALGAALALRAALTLARSRLCARHAARARAALRDRVLRV
ncbi:MAG: hypothetical protein KGL69_02895, partial [Alphaproteobacteria bacterium]|nr:hypothetical protein [Alphaproteobacteria bacterium]